MPDNVKIPGIGEVPKKYAYGAIAVVGGFIVIMYIRNKGASSAAAPAASDSNATDPNADSSGYGSYGDGGIDPSTGIPYTMESGYGGVSTGLDAAGYPIGSSADLQWNQSQQSGITTKTDWITQAEAVVPGDQGTIAQALTSVLAGLPVTTAQKNLFLEAVGILGNPPGGYPQPIKLTDTSAQPGTPAPVKVTVPNLIGQPQEAAFAIDTAAGLHTHGTPVVHGKVLYVVSQSPKAGTQVNKGSTVTVTSRVR